MRTSSPGRVSRSALWLAVPAVALLVAGCGNVAQSADAGRAQVPQAQPLQLSAANVSAPANATDCASAVYKHDNKHNICAWWVNNTHQFVGVGQLNTSPGPNFSKSRFSVSGAQQAHNINAIPGAFGESTFGATSAPQSYGANMEWSFNIVTPQETLQGSAQQTKNSNGSQTCGSTNYTACYVASSSVDKVRGHPTNQVYYNFANAPFAMNIMNNTGQAMSGGPTRSATGMSLSTTGSSSQSDYSSLDPGKSAVFALYRQVNASGASASYTAKYSFVDSGDDSITHTITVDVVMTPVTNDNNNSLPVQQWAVDTDKSSCSDNPSKPGASKAVCDLSWSGVGQWLDAAVLNVNVGQP